MLLRIHLLVKLLLLLLGSDELVDFLLATCIDWFLFIVQLFQLCLMVFSERVELSNVVNVVAFEVLVYVAEVDDSIELFDEVRLILVLPVQVVAV